MHVPTMGHLNNHNLYCDEAWAKRTVIIIVLQLIMSLLIHGQLHLMLTLIRIEIADIISAKTVYEYNRFSAQYNMERK